MTTTFESLKVQLAHTKALAEARKVAQEFANKHFNGQDGGPCGFSWVDVHGVRSNSKLGKALQEVGFRKSYSGSMQIWNKWFNGQSVDAGDHGAQAYARVFKEELELDSVYAGSRLD